MELKRDVIVDVGMHDGKDALYYAKRGFEVIAFEANPQLCGEVEARIAGAGIHIDLRNRAISDDLGELTFYVNKFNTTWSSLDREIGSRREGSEEIKVASCRLNEELADVAERLHYVKIDIEGYDIIALRQILMLEHLPSYLSVENGSDEMIRLMHDKGYERFKLSNQKYVPYQKIPPESVHGPVVDHEFLRSSSGMWGEDLIGGWMNFENMQSVLRALSLARHKASGNLWAEAIGWFDLHAKLS